MPAQKSKKPVQSAAKPVTRIAVKPAAKPTPLKTKAKAVVKPPVKKPELKVKTMPASRSAVKAPVIESKKSTPAAVAVEPVVKKKPGRPPKAVATHADAVPKTGAKRGRKPKIAPEFVGADKAAPGSNEPGLAGALASLGEKIKPLRMKISKAKERALMKEFGLDETVLSEEDLVKRRLRLKALIKLGKTRGYLTHGEISDHLPDKLVDAETLEVVISMLNDMGVAVYEQTPDAETLLLNNNGPTSATEEEAEEEAEAALSTVDSEFGRTTDPVRMYMREMGTVGLLTREKEIEIAKRIEEGLKHMIQAISACPATIAEILALSAKIEGNQMRIDELIDGFVEVVDEAVITE